MTLKPTGNYTRAALFALLALAVLAAEIVLIVRILSSGNSGFLAVLLPMVGSIGGCLAVPLTLIAVAAPVVMVRRERTLRAATANGTRQSPLASTQPERSLALRDGESISLTRRRLRISTMRDAAIALQFLTLIPAIGSPLLFVVLFGASLLDIGVFAYLFLVGAILVAGAFWTLSAIRGRWLCITADDRGVAVAHPFSVPHFIPWNDIVLFLRTTDNKSGAPDGSYLLWGRDHFIQFEIAGPGTAVEGKEKPGRRENVYRYEGGYETYAANAQRLLATIVARSYVPLRAQVGEPSAQTNTKRRRPFAAVRLEDALTAPIAPTALQPRPEAVAAAKQITGKLKLASQLTTPSFFAQALLVFFGLWASVVLLGILLPLPYFSLALLLVGDPFAILLFALLIPMLLLYAFFFAWAWRRRKLPAVTADDRALAAMSLQTIRIRWRDIRAWGVIPGTARRPTTYLVFSSDQTLGWVEPANTELGGHDVKSDLRTAFAGRAEQLHALIAARTGLQLRELRVGTDSDEDRASR